MHEAKVKFKPVTPQLKTQYATNIISDKCHKRQTTLATLSLMTFVAFLKL